MKTQSILAIVLLLAATTLYSQAPKAPSLPKTMCGRWDVSHPGGSKGLWEFKEDGTLDITMGTATTPGEHCRWEKVKDEIRVTYPDGGVTALEWPAKAGKMDGHDKNGRHVWLSKSKK